MTAHIIFVRFIGIYIDDAFIKDGLLDTAAMRPLARAGYYDYFMLTPETKDGAAPAKRRHRIVPGADP